MPTRSVDYRIDVLRGGVPYRQARYTGAPSVYCDADDAIHMTFRADLLQDPLVNYITDELQPVMILDGVEYPLGVYRVGSMSEQVNAAGRRTDSVTAYDRAVLLSWSKLESRDFWAAGTLYTSVIEHYLAAAGIRMAIVEGSAATLATDREDWDAGTSYLDIINTLLQEINYKTVWFDLNGAARIQAYTAPSASVLQHVYRDGDPVKVLGPAYGTQLDIFDAPNVFIGILENPEYPEPLTATAVNDAPASKISTISRGIRIPTIFKVENIADADADALQEYVNRVRDEGMRTCEYVDVQTVNLGTHGVGDMIGLELADLSGIFRERGWELTMQLGAMMHHRLERVVVI